MSKAELNLKTELERNLLLNYNLSCSNVIIEVKGTLVNIEGKVPDDETLFAIRDLAFSTRGVEAVNNYLYIDPFYKLQGVA